MSSPREAFARLARRPDPEIDLAEAALWIAAEEYPDLVVDDEMARLDALGSAAAARVEAAPSFPARVAALNRFLFVEERFRGNRDDYYDPRNSYLNEVLERRVGIPISLALVYLAVADRAGIEAAGISFPGHFLCKCVGGESARDRPPIDLDSEGVGDELVVIDAFAGGVVPLEECERRLSAAAGRPVRLDPEIHLRGASHREILVRVLGNLKQIFVGRGDYGAALSCSDRILLLFPDASRERAEREALRARVPLH